MRLFSDKSSRAILLAFLAAILTISSPGGASAARTLNIVALGDSLFAGYGLPEGQSFPARLQAELAAKGREVTIANAGVSGDTSAGGLARLDWSVPEGTDAVLVELGANDALRGLPPEQTEANLDAIVSRLAERGIAVLIAGMRAPPNMGQPYAEAFDPIFARIAEKHGAALYPFYLDGVAAVPALNQPDGMHPNAKGVDEIVARFLPVMQAFLDTLPGEDGK